MGKVNLVPGNYIADEQFSMAGTNYLIERPDGKIIIPYIEKLALNIKYSILYDISNGPLIMSHPSILGGIISNGVNLDFGNTAVQMAVWYDRWSGFSSDYVYVVWLDIATSDIKFRTINFTGNYPFTLGSIVTVFSGTSYAAGGTLSITRTRGGNLIVSGCIDAGTESFCYKSSDAGVNWSSIASPYEATTDQLWLLPGWAADNQDAQCVYVDASADGLSVKYYDDSANSWSEETIVADGSFIDQSASTAYPHVSCSVDLVNSQNIVVGWNAVDTANADLICAIINTSVTLKTNVITNSVDDQGLCAISIKTDISPQEIMVFYGGKSDGSETYYTSISTCFRVSSDGGSTWSSEYVLGYTNQMRFMMCAPISTKTIYAFITSGLLTVYQRAILQSYSSVQKAFYQLGM